MAIQNGVCGGLIQPSTLRTTYSFQNVYEMNQREKMLLTGEHSDVEFDVGSKEQKSFRAHKFILTAGSPKFAKMLELHTSSFPIRIPEIEPKMFEQLLSALYLNKFHLDNHDIARECAQLFSDFGLHSAVKECLNYIKSRKLNADNVISIFELIERDTGGIGNQECLHVFRTQTRDVLTTEDFLKARLDTIMTIFGQDELDIVSENDLLNALHMYADVNTALPGHNADGDQARFEQMVLPALQKIRFLAMPLPDLARSNAAYSLLTMHQLLSITMLVIAPDGILYEMPEGFSTSTIRRAKLSKDRSLGNCSTASSTTNIQNTAQINSQLTNDSSAQVSSAKNFPTDSTCDWSLPQVAMVLGSRPAEQPAAVNLVTESEDDSGWTITSDPVEKHPLGNSTVDSTALAISESVFQLEDMTPKASIQQCNAPQQVEKIESLHTNVTNGSELPAKTNSSEALSVTATPVSNRSTQNDETTTTGAPIKKIPSATLKPDALAFVPQTKPENNNVTDEWDD